ncbi:MAG: hypothetical protein NVS3B27_00160 [Novosphingobium sp.]
MERTRADDHLARGIGAQHRLTLAKAEIDARGATVLDHDTMGPRAGLGRQIGPFGDRREIAARRAPALAIGDRQLIAPETLLIVPVEIVGQLVPRLPPRLDTGAVERMIGTFAPCHRQRPAGAVKGIGPVDEVFRAFEIGQRFGIGPAVQTHLPPLVVIARVPADIDHAVDRR